MNAGCMWFDGKLVSTSRAKIPITTHAIHYGTSAFEGIRAYWNGDNLHIFRLDEHLKRFRKSGEYYNMSLKFTDEQLVEAIIKLCRKNNLKKGLTTEYAKCTTLLRYGYPVSSASVRWTTWFEAPRTWIWRVWSRVRKKLPYLKNR